MQHLFDIESEVLPTSASVLAFHGTESFSRPYQFEIQLHVEEDGIFFDMAAAVGNRATLLLLDDEGAPRSSIHGVINGLELVEALPHDTLYRVGLVPKCWWLAQSRHSRVFVKQTVPQILEEVLSHAGLSTPNDFEIRLRGKYTKLDHVCQYQESDLDFISRWMEREGIYYYFEQGKSQEKLIIVDQASIHEKLDGGPKRYFPRRGPDESPVEAFRAFRWAQNAQAAGVRIADYNYLSPSMDLSHKAKVRDGEGPLLSIYGENLYWPEEAKRLATIKVEGLKARQVIYRGLGRVYDLRPGYRFSLDNHPQLDPAKELLVTEVIHSGSQVDGAEFEVLNGGGESDYSVEVVAIPAEVQYRPPCVTMTPRIEGLESAVIDGPVQDIYAQIDDHGRYLVKIHFDESDVEAGNNSMRVRMLQPHGGSNEGFHFPLRKGTEVMLAFLGGHPDRPVIVGVGPNFDTPSPVTQFNATQNVLQSGGLNRLVMEDTKDQQYVDLESPVMKSALHLGAHEGARAHNAVLTTDGSCLIHSGEDRNITVGGNQTEEVQKDLIENYKGIQSTLVEKDRTDTVNGNETTEVKGSRNDSVRGEEDCLVEGNRSQRVLGKHERFVEKDLQQTVNGSMWTNVAKGQTNVVDGFSHEYVKGKLTQTANGGAKISTPLEYEVEAGQEIKFKAPKIDVNATNMFETSVNKKDWFFGYKNSMTIGMTTEYKVGVFAEINASLKVAGNIFVIENEPLKIENVGTKLSNGLARIISAGLHLMQ